MSVVTKKVTFGVGWMLLFKLCDRSLGAASTIVLARILVPEDFGLIAMAMSIIAMVELLRAFNFDTVLIQRQNADEATYNSIWTLNLVFSAFVFALLLVAAWPAAAFYSDSRLENIIHVLAVATLISGFENIGIVAFRKQLQFDKEFMFLVIKKVVGVSVNVSLAVALRSYWALIAGVLASSLCGVILSYVLQPFRPKFCVRSAGDVLRYSKWLFFNNVLFFLRHRGIDFVVGKLAGAHALGVLTMAVELATLPTTEMVQSVNRALFPGYAKLNDNVARLAENYIATVAWIAIFVFPAGVGVALTADLLVPILLGSNWGDAIPAIELLALHGILVALQTNGAYVYLALGKARLVTALQIVSLAIMFPLLIWLTSEHGLRGAAWSQLLAVSIMAPINYFFILRVLELGSGAIAGAFWRPALATAAMAVAYTATASYLPATAEIGPLAVRLACGVLGGAIFYVVALLVLWRLAGMPPGPERAILARVPWPSAARQET